MISRPRIVIVGGGIGGLATAWSLGNRKDCHVVLVERESAFGLHSTGRNASILRTAIPDGPLRQLGMETRRFLDAPPHGFAERPLVDPCGLVVIAPRDTRHPWESDPPSPAQELDADQFARMAPHYRNPVERAILFPEEGRLDVPLLTGSLARGASNAGVELRTSAAVDDLILRSGEVCGVRLADGEELEADWTVIAAGGWAGRLGARAGSRVSMTPTRRHLAVSSPDRSVDPRWPVVWSDMDGFYSRPEAGGLMLCCCDQTEVDPDRCDTVPSIRDEIAAVAQRHLGEVGALPIEQFWAGMRTMTDDGRFLVGADGQVPGLFWVAGLGGHGMTTSMATGRLAADLLVGDLGIEDPLARDLSPARPAALGSRTSASPQVS